MKSYSLKNNPLLLVFGVVAGLVAITAFATVTSTTPAPDRAASAEVSTGPDFGGTSFSAPPPLADVSETVAVAPKEIAPLVETKLPAGKAQSKTKHGKKIAWEKSYETALKKAKATGKLVMIDFYADWCIACKHLDKNIYTAAPVVAESANFISVKVNAEKRDDLQVKYQVYNFPTIMWVNELGAEVARLRGAPHAVDYMVEQMRAARKLPTRESVL